MERFRIAFTANVRFAFIFSRKKKITRVHRSEKCKLILTFDANAKRLNFTEKLKRANDKCRIKHGHVLNLALFSDSKRTDSGNGKRERKTERGKEEGTKESSETEGQGTSMLN